MINKLALALAGVLFCAFAAPLPALADAATDARNKDWDINVKEIEKLAKKKKCKDVITYREVLPFFGRETTLDASRKITVQFEKEDLASGRAIILHEKSKCDDLIGSFFVMCTTDTTLCYFHEKKNAGKGKKLVKLKGKKGKKTKAVKKQ
ncbi:MAG: hypothetical protein L3J67_11075 [Hyphomicrobiaceae bacterium]|nr:hypothetical protein [Hyphomicrobiaceae bacterium]